MWTLTIAAQEHYTAADSTFVTQLLTEARSLSRTTNFPLHFARKFIGRPYVAHTLEVYDPEQLVVNTRQLDCTTLVENVTALTLCTYRNLYTWRDYLNALVQMRYRHGKLDGYTSRLHYFTDWIEDNTRKDAPQVIYPFHRTLSRAKDRKSHFFMRIIRIEKCKHQRQ